MDIARIQYELKELLGFPVDVLTPRALPDRFREQVIREAIDFTAYISRQHR